MAKGQLQLVPQPSECAALRDSICGNVYSFTRGKIGLAATILDPVMNPLDGLTLNAAVKAIRTAVGTTGQP